MEIPIEAIKYFLFLKGIWIQCIYVVDFPKDNSDTLESSSFGQKFVSEIVQWVVMHLSVKKNKGMCHFIQYVL